MPHRMLFAVASVIALAGCACLTPQPTKFFAESGKTVVTFVGYSGSGYEDEAAMLAAARETLSRYKPNETIVNIGATEDGVGAVYAVAKSLGFETAGIVSTQAKIHAVPVSKSVDHVFYVEDDTWGGLVEGTDRLSPTSAAMVDCSDVVIGIGGGMVARDELLAARARGKTVRFIAADMNHAVAREKARRKGQPEPTDFRGAASAAFRESEELGSV